MDNSGPAKFIRRSNRRGRLALPALSVFSGAGLSDVGYELAGFKFHVQCEKDKHRARLGHDNFPESAWIVEDVRDARDQIVATYNDRANNTRPALMTLTPPCQGMSSSNPGRGKITEAAESDHRNTLLLECLPIVEALQPRVVVAENVAPLLNRVVDWNGTTATVVTLYAAGLRNYRLFAGIVEMADYGIPQMRKRSILVAVREDEEILQRLTTRGLLPWPRPTHGEQPMFGRETWLTMRDWFEFMAYPPLDARTNPTDAEHSLHCVPKYPEDDRRYEMIADIPANSGQNGYANSVCPTCHRNSIPEKVAYCPHCGGLLTNRPITRGKRGPWRLIKGFASSYRRAAPDQPAPTITTNTSHLGSDNKIHPWENRVLSTLECADLQTVPRFFDWTWALETRHSYVVRNAIGEALPPFFTFLHGRVLSELLTGRVPRSQLSHAGVDGQDRVINQNDETS